MARTKRNKKNSPPPKLHPNSQYSHDYPQRAFELCHDHGARSKDVAAHFGVDESTLTTWLRKYEELRKSITEGKDIFDQNRVENALLKRVLGYQYETVTTESINVTGKLIEIDAETNKRKTHNISIDESITLYDEHGNEVILNSLAVKTKLTTSEFAPDPKSIFFWLQNRSSERWKNVRYVEAKVEGSIAVKHNHIHSSLKNIGLGDLGKYLSDAELSFLQEIAERVQARKAEEMHQLQIDQKA